MAETEFHKRLWFWLLIIGVFFILFALGRYAILGKSDTMVKWALAIGLILLLLGVLVAVLEEQGKKTTELVEEYEAEHHLSNMSEPRVRSSERSENGGDWSESVTRSHGSEYYQSTTYTTPDTDKVEYSVIRQKTN